MSETAVRDLKLGIDHLLRFDDALETLQDICSMEYMDPAIKRRIKIEIKALRLLRDELSGEGK